MDTEIEQACSGRFQTVWSPEFTFTSLTTYRTPIGLSIGGGAARGQRDPPGDDEWGAAARERHQHDWRARTG